MTDAVHRRLARERGRWQAIAARLAAASPRRDLERLRSAGGDLEQRLLHLMPRLLQPRRAGLARVGRTLAALSPLATLARGYAIVTTLPEAHVLHDAAALAVGDVLEVRLANGRLHCRVERKIMDNRR
jgi:exodeoxyribonuclease VII large subunit